jgi:hypothetical protein
MAILPFLRIIKALVPLSCSSVFRAGVTPVSQPSSSGETVSQVEEVEGGKYRVGEGSSIIGSSLSSFEEHAAIRSRDRNNGR